MKLMLGIAQAGILYDELYFGYWRLACIKIRQNQGPSAHRHGAGEFMQRARRVRGVPAA
jgi:hypothetical protein